MEVGASKNDISRRSCLYWTALMLNTSETNEEIVWENDMFEVWQIFIINL